MRSGVFPRSLGYLLAITCVGYLVDLGARYLLAPGIEGAVLPVSAVAGAIGELSFMAWLLVKGAGRRARRRGRSDTIRGEVIAAAVP